jgi:hypothetical protein
LVSVQNSATLVANFPLNSQQQPAITCPAGHPNCAKVSYPELYNNVFWQNRSFYIGVGALGGGTLNQQNVVTLYNAFSGTAAPSQTATGGCPAGVSYWDIGVRGDTGPTNHASTVTLSPEASILTSIAGYPGGGTGFKVNLAPTPSNLALVSQYCNGSRVPPEFGGTGYQVPPGISDATVPNPVFDLTPAATVDEGNNWINLSWGPLAETNPVTNALLGNYGLTAGSTAIGYITNGNSATTYAAAPTLDFFGTARKANNAVDVGAVEFQAGPPTATLSVTGGPLNFGNVVIGTTSGSQQLVLHNTGTAAGTGITLAFASTPTGGFSRATAGGTCGATLAAGATCTINVVFTPSAVGAYTGTLTITANVTVTGSPVNLSGTGVAATHLATVAPSPLAFGNWATGTTSNPLNLTVTNTGNSALAGGSFTFGGGTPQPFSRVTTGTFPAGAPNCGATLAVGATCTVKVQFAPATAVAFSRTLTVAYTGATVTGSPVTLTGTGVAARATVSITPNPLTITLPSCSPTPTLACTSGTGTVTLTNTAAAGGSSVAVTNVAATGGTMLTYLFTNGSLAGPDSCTGQNIAPGTNCTVTVRFTNIGSARGTNRAGTITFTDTGAGSPQSGNLIGFATP